MKLSSVISPADANCDQSNNCKAASGPGYNIFISESCLPTPEAKVSDPDLVCSKHDSLHKGMTVSNIAPNEDMKTFKPMDLTANEFKRYYVALSKKKTIAAGDAACSVAFNIGELGSGNRARPHVRSLIARVPSDTSSRQSCVIYEYFPNITSQIPFCTPPAPFLPAGQELWIVFVPIVAGLFAGGKISDDELVWFVRTVRFYSACRWSRQAKFSLLFMEFKPLMHARQKVAIKNASIQDAPISSQEASLAHQVSAE
eukprot:763376-Hanusia_phi.AAC.4